MKLRADRWRQNPAKDVERAGQIAPYEKALRRLAVGAGLSRDELGRKAPPPTDQIRWLVEEFRVSLFAQELGTAEPVSAVKLDRAFAALGPGSSSSGTEPAAAPKAIVSAPVAPRKSTPLKNLGSLDKLFPR